MSSQKGTNYGNAAGGAGATSSSFKDSNYPFYPQQTIPKDFKGKISLESSFTYSNDKRPPPSEELQGTERKYYEGALQFKDRHAAALEEEMAINNWKDQRIRKLEDFTKDLMMSAESNSHRKPQQQYPERHSYRAQAAAPSTTNNGVGATFRREIDTDYNRQAIFQAH